MSVVSSLSRAQITALGPTAALPSELRRALSSEGFAPMPKPGERDWLSTFDEKGQTYADFVASKCEAPDEHRRTLALAPLGMTAQMTSWKEFLRAGLEAFYSLPSRLMRPMLLSEVKARSRINEGTGKRQFLTRDILEFLKQRLPEDAFAVAAITAEDLYPDESWNFVFGQASLQERVGVFSFARYDARFDGGKPSSERLVLVRTLKVLLHEVGHMFGLHHCVYFSCLMNGANHLEEADATPLHVCPICLRKLQRAIGFDVVLRYEELEAFWRRAGFPNEANWVADRLRQVRAAA